MAEITNSSNYSAGQNESSTINNVDVARLFCLQFSFVVEVALNIFIVAVLASDRDIDFIQIDKYLYKLLAYQDIVLSLLYNVFSSALILGQYFHIDADACMAFGPTCFFCFHLSAWILCAVALNKFLFIKYPLRYYSMVTKRRVKGFLVAGGIFSLGVIGVLPFEGFPFADIGRCSVSGLLRSVDRITTSGLFFYIVFLFLDFSIPIVATVLLNFSLIAVAVKQARSNRRVAAMVPTQPDQSKKETRNERDRNRVKRRGLLNVLYLLNTASIILISTGILCCIFFFQPGNVSYKAVLFACDIPTLLWLSKVGVLIISDVKMRKAAKNFLSVTYCKIKVKSLEV